MAKRFSKVDWRDSPFSMESSALTVKVPTNLKYETPTYWLVSVTAFLNFTVYPFLLYKGLSPLYLKSEETLKIGDYTTFTPLPEPWFYILCDSMIRRESFTISPSWKGREDSLGLQALLWSAWGWWTDRWHEDLAGCRSCSDRNHLLINTRGEPEGKKFL